MGSRILRSVFSRAVTYAGVGIIGYFVGKYLGSPTQGTVKLYSIENSFPFVQASSFLSENPLNFPNNLPPDIKDVPMPVKDVIKDTTVPRISQIMKYGFPSLDNILSYGNFVLSYDKRNRVAHWVFEHLNKETVQKNDAVDRSNMDFFPDESIHPFFRATNSDYKRSGYDRGHLAAAGNHKSSPETCKKTFILSNIAPQVGEGFNRSSWNRLEKHVRKLARKYKDVYVCTGPLYLPRKESDGKTYIKYQVIGTNTVAVPTHFFKVIVIEDSSNNLQMESYVMPNEAIPDDVPLSSFQVPVESIERASGLLFFDKIPRKVLKSLNGK